MNDKKVSEDRFFREHNLYTDQYLSRDKLTPANERPVAPPLMNPTYNYSFKENCDRKLNELSLGFTYESDERIFMNCRDKEIADEIVRLMREIEFLKYTKKDWLNENRQYWFNPR